MHYLSNFTKSKYKCNYKIPYVGSMCFRCIVQQKRKTNDPEKKQTEIFPTRQHRNVSKYQLAFGLLLLKIFFDIESNFLGDLFAQ